MKKMPTITTAMKKAGILEIHCQNTNGSYKCTVQLDKINLMDSSTNFRALDPKWVNKIVAKFDPASVRDPLLNFNGDALITADGRHTVSSLRVQNVILGPAACYNTITADVFLGLPIQAILRIFRNLNDGKRMNSGEKMLAGRLAGDEDAVYIFDALESHGFTFGAPKTGADITSVKILKEIYKAKIVHEYLEVLKAFRIGSRLFIKGESVGFLQGLANCVKDCKANKIPMERLFLELSKRPASYYYDEARKIQEEKKDHRIAAPHYCEAFKKTLVKDMRALASAVLA